jgi:hypothetical protein
MASMLMPCANPEIALAVKSKIKGLLLVTDDVCGKVRTFGSGFKYCGQSVILQ